MPLNEEKLAELRQRYADGKHDDPRDPALRRVADLLFDESGERCAPYAGMPTLLKAPHRPIDPASPDFADLQIALLGVPMDLGVTNRSGARFGPRALRAMERIGPYNEVHGNAPVHEMRVADIGDVPFTSRFDLAASHRDIETHLQIIRDAGVLPVCVGGDHSITHPIMKALGRDRPLGMIHFDAHCDTGGPFEGEKFHHGGPFRNAVLDGVLDPERCIQIGIRGAAEFLWEFSTVSGMTVVHANEMSDLGIERIIAMARDVVGDDPAYLTFDVDGLDPVYAPGTGTPEVGGFSSREALAMVRGMRGLNLIGGDVVEVAPQYDATTNTAQIGGQLLFEIVSLLQFSPALNQR